VLATSFLIATQPTFATIDNTATATGTPSSGTLTAPTSNTVSVPVTAANASLSIAKSVVGSVTTANGADNAIIDAGDTITYQYIVTNNGNITLTSVVPIDPKPNFGPSQLLGTGTFGGFTIQTGTSTLAPGQSVTYRNIYTLSQLDIDRAGGVVVPANAVNNSALASGVRPNATTYTATIPGTATTVIAPYPKLSIVKSYTLSVIGGPANATTADVGELITYTYTVQNVGNVTINNVSVNDTHEGAAIAAGLITNETLSSDGPLAAAPDSLPSTDATAANGVWSVLRPGATVTFTYVHTVNQTEFNNQ
jgi:uncharacterized repeat protein (TIGR01451 family)